MTPWEDVDRHMKEMRDFLIKDRADTVAQAQREADEARARGDERWSRLWQGRADELTAYRFHWERAEEAA
ncbi:hypothetical protein [Phytohabitans suffuscus]|uniref:Uncharacterized protein n=1 Tax=Phytohabitans suffuscus TaxID=624315 RepID=A0A6F8YDB0_9ACTN|nr:hypothetical protein [Phytohabitans suffuscus]BCB84047.1 hypothetical protein Psuf_013600 [Phytohabitans suffuscus]